MVRDRRVSPRDPHRLRSVGVLHVVSPDGPGPSCALCICVERRPCIYGNPVRSCRVQDLVSRRCLQHQTHGPGGNASAGYYLPTARSPVDRCHGVWPGRDGSDSHTVDEGRCVRQGSSTVCDIDDLLPFQQGSDQPRANTRPDARPASAPSSRSCHIPTMYVHRCRANRTPTHGSCPVSTAAGAGRRQRCALSSSRSHDRPSPGPGRIPFGGQAGGVQR